MARFYGKIGYGQTEEVRRGVWEDVITERKLYGDVLRPSRTLDSGEKVNNDISVGNSISVVADAYANEHFFAIRYVEYQKVLWTVSKVDVEAPRLILRLGGVYHGPTPSAEQEGGTA